MTLEFSTSEVIRLWPFLEDILQDGGRKQTSFSGAIRPIKDINGMSGFEYEENEGKALILVGPIMDGSGFILRRALFQGGETDERYDYFNLQGDIILTADKESFRPLKVDLHEMDLACPILNLFYSYLAAEYKKASEGKSQTQLVHSIEQFLRNVWHSKHKILPIKKRTNDPAVDNIYNKILTIEMDPVLHWEERQLVYKHLHEDLKRILNTKIRAHKLSKLTLIVAIFFRNTGNFLARLLARPLDNSKGLIHRYTIGKIIWFFQTVRNNLGYSIALAVYGPFTYYFITMPMNPHAMQAVGKVRATYLELKTDVVQLLDQGEIVINDIKSKEAMAANPTDKSDPVTTKSSSQSGRGKTVKVVPANNVIGPSEVTTKSGTSYLFKHGPNKLKKETPTFLNMLLSTDSSGVNSASWSERMSDMKQMQIAYEENIEFASRMGRLEQLETQYNFPMQVESTWEELERYNNFIFKIREENPNLSAKMKQYLYNEINRTQQLELYLWDRMSRFMLDQIYVMLDQDKEQKRNDYYVGRSFVFMEEMTKILSWRYKNLKLPKGHEKIRELANFYSKIRKEQGNVLKNLKANSNLFQQKDVYDTKEFRAYMKRQWEILYLQNSKAEEASNNGLNMYIWSVRNTIWILQSIYSAKREELALLIKRDASGHPLSPSEMLTRSKISMLYETLFHNLNLEYVGIREEIMNRLGKDIESTQRMIVINNLKEFLTDRDKLDNQTTQNQKTAGATI